MRKEIYSYTAGLIDGEGCIGIRKKKHQSSKTIYYILHVEVHMASSVALQFLHQHFGGSFIKISKRYENRRQLYRWDIFARKAKTFLEQILPYLLIKKQEAILAIEFQSTHKHHCNKKGFTSRPQSVSKQQEIFYQKLRHLKLPQ